jgi:hypothetical protein
MMAAKKVSCLGEEKVTEYGSSRQTEVVGLRTHCNGNHFWEYINGNQTFILDSHRPFICSALTLPVE